MKSRNYNLVHFLVILILFSILCNNNFSEKGDSKNNNRYNFISLNFLQNSYAIESDEKEDDAKKQDEDNNKDKEKEFEAENNNKGNSMFNIVAVGDWDCTSETEDTVDNIIKQDPEFVLALGDLSYNGKAKCWLKLIEPIADKTKIVIGNHEVDSSKLLKDYMDYFELEEQYYSFNYGNVHFIVLSTEMDFDDDSEQYQFAVDDLEKYSNDTSIDWIVASFHKQVYSSGSSPEDEEDFREIYHPLFDKYNVDLALEGHLHAYERMYPITFNSNDEDEPIVMDTNPSTYNNTNGTIFITVGTGGAHDMELSSLDSFSGVGIDGDFGILDINLNSSNTNNNESSNDTNNNKILTGKFIENEDDDEFKILDEFKIIKTS